VNERAAIRRPGAVSTDQRRSRKICLAVDCVGVASQSSMSVTAARLAATSARFGRRPRPTSLCRTSTVARPIQDKPRRGCGRTVPKASVRRRREPCTNATTRWEPPLRLGRGRQDDWGAPNDCSEIIAPDRTMQRSGQVGGRSPAASAGVSHESDRDSGGKFPRRGTPAQAMDVLQARLRRPTSGRATPVARGGRTMRPAPP